MRFAIRDDDTCYFTAPEQLDRVYRRLPGIPVSLAVTPFALQSFHLGDPARFRQGREPHVIERNHDLVAHLREGVQSGRYTILCHGFSHEYHHVDNKWIPECVWKGAQVVAAETELGARLLGDLLACDVGGYVPPGNAITRANIEAVGSTFPRLFATLPVKRWREFVLDPVGRAAWKQRLFDQIKLGGPQPQPYHLGQIQMLTCTSLTALASWDSIVRRLRLCQAQGADFVVAVHYWELCGPLLDRLCRLVDLAHSAGFQPAHCASLFEDGDVYADTRQSIPRKEASWANSKTS
jgi:hypothetical protein